MHASEQKCKMTDEGRKETFEGLDERYEHTFAMLFTMEQRADSFCIVR